MEEPLNPYKQVLFATPISKSFKNQDYIDKLVARGTFIPEVATRSAENFNHKNKVTFMNVLQNIYRVDAKENPERLGNSAPRVVMSEVDNEYQQRHLNRNMSWDSFGYFSDQKENFNQDAQEGSGFMFAKRISEVEYYEFRDSEGELLADHYKLQPELHEEREVQRFSISEPEVSAFATAIETFSYDGSDLEDPQQIPQLNQIQQQGLIRSKSAEQKEESEQLPEPIAVKKVSTASEEDPYSDIKAVLNCQIYDESADRPRYPSDSFFKPEYLSRESFLWGKQLGKGYLGEVFITIHKTSGFICAMKVISKQSIVRENVMQQILRQLAIHWSCRHPNIAQMYGFFWDDDNLYIMQELCTEGEVFGLLKRKHRLAEAETKYLLKQVLEAVRYLHVNCILHRDIKPENILLQYGVVKITDFGWSVQSACLRNSRCVGTPLYQAPEEVKEEPHDERVDIWAIGMLTYELLIGHLPFWICCEQDMKRIVDEEVKFTQYVQISQQSKQFILHALAKDPNKRIRMLDMMIHGFICEAHQFQYFDL